MLPVMEQEIKEQGATLVGRAAVKIEGSDSEAAVEALRGAKPSAVLVMSFGVSVVNVVRAVRQTMGIPVCVVSVATTGNTVSRLGEDSRGMAVTQVLPYPWKRTTPLIREFTALADRAKVPVSYESLLGYLNMRVLLEDLKRVKGPVTSASMVTAMERLGTFDLGGFPLHFSPTNHHGSRFVEITIVGPDQRFMR